MTSVKLLTIFSCLSLIVSLSGKAAVGEMCPQPQTVEGASLESRIFISGDKLGIEFERPANYLVVKINDNLIAVIDKLGGQYLRCVISNKLESELSDIHPITLEVAYDRETLLNAFKHGAKFFTIQDHSYWVYETTGEEYRFNALTLDKKNNRLIIVSTPISKHGEFIMEAGFLQILATLKF